MAGAKLHGDRRLVDFDSIDGNGSRTLIRHGYQSYAPWLMPAGGAIARRMAERLVSGGRQAHPLLLLPDGQRVLVRGYRRGGLIGKLNRRYYFRGHRAFDELRATLRAAAGGVYVPEVIAAAEHRVGIGYIATITTRWIEGAVDAAAWQAVATEPERLDFLHETGRQIARMHWAGISHPDLTLRNILVVRPGEAVTPTVYLIDFDRARVSASTPPRLRRARDLRRLEHSARKLGLPLGGAEGWRALRSGYGADWPLPERG